MASSAWAMEAEPPSDVTAWMMTPGWFIWTLTFSLAPCSRASGERVWTMICSGEDGEVRVTAGLAVSVMGRPWLELVWIKYVPGVPVGCNRKDGRNSNLCSVPALSVMVSQSPLTAQESVDATCVICTGICRAATGL